MSQPPTKEAEEKSLTKKADDLSLDPNHGTVRGPRQSEKRTIMLVLLRSDLQGRFRWASCPWVTDYTTTVWSRKRFPNDQGDLTFNDVAFEKENRRTGSASVTFSWKEQMKFNKSQPAALSQDHITAINALAFHRVSTADQTMRVRANSFYVASGFTSLDGLAAYRGYFTSARASNERLLLNVNTVTTPFLEPMLVSSLMTILKRHGGEYNLQSVLKNVRVRVIYDRTRHVPDRDPNTEELRMKVINAVGRYPDQELITAPVNQTVAMYFRNLGYSIKNPKLECIDVGTRDQTIWIPPELLEITDSGQQFRAPLSSQHTTKMIKAALRGPAANAQLIVEEALGNNLMGIKPRDMTVMHPLGISISDHMLQIPYSKSEIPRIEYGKNSNNTFPLAPKAAAWNLKDYHFYRSAAGPNNSEIQANLCILGKMLPKDRQRISKGMNDAFSALGMKVQFKDKTGRCFEGLEYNGDQRYEDSLKRELDKWYGTGLDPQKKPKFLGPLLIVLSRHNKAAYTAIKRWADCHIGIQTVCAVSEKIGEARPQYCANLALKFNPKLGGINHRILVPKNQGDPAKSDPPKSDPREFAFYAIKDTTIVMGADVVHPPMGGMPGCPSIAALVASEDSDFFNFPGSMRLNLAREEIIANLEDMVVERLLRYRVLNHGKMPLNILFYRDGVSEGQYNAVNDQEVPKIRAAWSKAQGLTSPRFPDAQTGGSPRIHFIVVQKRHHVRFYAAHKDQCNNPARPDGNVKPGLLVNTVITRPQDPNFYLQSHAAIQGTARSAHYVILHDEIPELRNRSANRNDVPEALTDITHAFCYNYARATKGVSYCGPTYYADRLCDRGYHHMRKVFDGTLSPPKQNNGKTDRDFHIRVKNTIENHSYWNFSNFKQLRRNPWHPNMDNTMFYL